MNKEYGVAESTGIRVRLPAGMYYLGDPCYTLGNDDDVWQACCNALQNGPDVGGVIRKNDNGIAIAFTTAHGDGEYKVTKLGRRVGEVGVDAGLIGLVPVGMVEKPEDSSLVMMVSFPHDFTCETDGKTLSFNYYEVDTDV